MLIPACAIGAGLFSFPIIAGLSGFMPGAFAILITYGFSTFIGLLIADMCCHTYTPHHQSTHFFALTEKFLPRTLQVITLMSFLFICYGSLIGYLDGMIISMQAIQKINLPNKIYGLCLILFLTGVIYQDNRIITYITNMLFPITFIIYLYFSYLAYSALNTTYLSHVDYTKIAIAFPTLVTAFSFQLMIPSMSRILQGNKNHLRWAIIIGTTINCLMYFAWFFIMLGINPISNLREAFLASTTLTASIPSSHTWGFQLLGNIFAFITMFTSFTSISISIKDYWYEILSTKTKHNSLYMIFKAHIEHSNMEEYHKIQKYLVQLLIFLPIAIIFLTFNKLFLWIFSSTGGYGDAIAFGLMPIYMSYIAIKHHKMSRDYPIVFYILAIAFFVFVFYIQVSADLQSIITLLNKAVQSAKIS